MDEEEKKPIQKRSHHLRVPVLPDEQEKIEGMAKQVGLSVAAYLREIGQGYQVTGVVDYEQVRELARINGDLGRLGGLLKLWLTDDFKAAEIGKPVIVALLKRIEANQSEMALVMKKIVRPKAVEL